MVVVGRFFVVGGLVQQSHWEPTAALFLRSRQAGRPAASSTDHLALPKAKDFISSFGFKYSSSGQGSVDRTITQHSLLIAFIYFQYIIAAKTLDYERPFFDWWKVFKRLFLRAVGRNCMSLMGNHHLYALIAICFSNRIFLILSHEILTAWFSHPPFLSPHASAQSPLSLTLPIDIQPKNLTISIRYQIQGNNIQEHKRPNSQFLFYIIFPSSSQIKSLRISSASQALHPYSLIPASSS